MARTWLNDFWAFLHECGAHLRGDLSLANWHNLTSLWDTLGARPIALPPISDRAIRMRGCRQWPHRHWFLDAPSLAVTELLTSLPSSAVVSVHADLAPRQALRDASFTLAFEQRAMVLELQSPISLPQSNLEICEVHERSQLSAWREVASQSFGYEIDATPTERLLQNEVSRLLLLLIDGHPAACALLYRSAAICGIHQIGVLPHYRKRGLARELMLEVLHRAKAEGASHATLQASRLGLSLYRKLGFVEQFVLETHARDPRSQRPTT